MKKIIAFVVCLFTLSISFAQKSTPADAKKLIATKRSAIAGIITDQHNFPLKGVKAFIYQADSSIIASGYTDDQGRYETNSVSPGTYLVKIMYPDQKATMISGVILKPGITPVNIKAEPPATDTAISYSDIAPKPVEKKRARK